MDSSYHAESGPIDADLVELIDSQFPTPVNMAPDSIHVLVKTRKWTSFSLAVINIESGALVAQTCSPENQLALTWSPQGDAIAFLAAHDGDARFRPFVWDLSGNSVRALQGPATRTAVPALRWTADGKRIAYFVGDSIQGTLWSLDPRGYKPAQIVARDVQLAGDFAWSPNGRAIAFVKSSAPCHVTILDTTTEQVRSIALDPSDPDGEIRGLSWGRSGSTLAVSARIGENFVALYRVDLKTAKVNVLARTNGDILMPVVFGDGRRVLYKVRSEAEERLYLIDFVTVGTPSQVEFFAGRIHSIALAPRSGSAVISYTSCEDAPALYELPPAGRHAKLIYAAPNAGRVRAVHVRKAAVENGSVRVPVLVWRDPLSSCLGKRRLVFVHGGPRLNEYASWTLLATLMSRRGIGVTAVNYRGSSGYGREMEESGTFENAVDDVVAVCKYAAESDGRRLILVGESYGACVAVCAAASCPGSIAGLVLLSTLGRPSLASSALSATSFPVVAFHGKNDWTPPPVARKAIEARLGPDVFSRPVSAWRVFPTEGHAFSKTESWAEVYSAIAALCSDGPSRR